MKSPDSLHHSDEAVASALVAACKQSDTQQVQSLVSRYPTAVQYPDANGWTSLHHALYHGAPLAIIHALVLADPRVLATRSEREKCTVLHCAAGCPQTKGSTIDFLIQQRSALATELDSQGRSALHWVCQGRPDRASGKSHADLGVVRKIYEAWNDATFLPDEKGILPIHASYLSGAPGSYLKYLGSLDPGSVSTALPNGRLLAHCVAQDLAQGKEGIKPEVLESLIQADSATLYVPDPITGMTLKEAAQSPKAAAQVRDIIKNYDGSTGLSSQFPSAKDSKSGSSMKIGKSVDLKTKESDSKSVLKYSDDQVADMIVRACAQDSASMEEIVLLVKAYPRAVRVRDQEDFLPLHWACYHGASVPMLKLLLSAWPESIHETISQDRLPLHLACRQSATLHGIQFLVSQYPEALEKATSQGMLPIHYACRDAAPLDVIQYMIDEAPMTLSESNSNGSLPIHFACKHAKSPETIRFLVERWPACLREHGKDGLLPIHFLCRGTSFADLEWMIMQDSQVLKIVDAEGNLALHHICKNSKATVQAAQVVFEGYPDAAKQLNSKNATPLHLAAQVNPAVSEFLSSAETKRRKTGGCRPLHQACTDPRMTVQIIRDILAESPDEVCIPDDERCLPVHIACRSGASLDVVRCLVEDWPESLRWTNKGGSLPLHTACSNKADLSVVKYLISAFPKATGIANNYGWLPLHCACAHSASSEVISLLVQSDDKSSRVATYGQGDYPLHLACSGPSSLEVIYWLAEACQEGAKVANNAGELALHKACFNNAPIEVVQFLVEQFPRSVFVEDEYGATPLKIAQLRKHHAIAEYLKSKEV